MPLYISFLKRYVLAVMLNLGIIAFLWKCSTKFVDSISFLIWLITCKSLQRNHASGIVAAISFVHDLEAIKNGSSGDRIGFSVLQCCLVLELPYPLLKIIDLFVGDFGYYL